jgi:Family of unknown function (DUF6781)
MKNETSDDTTLLEAQVRNAVERGHAVQDKVRQLTLRMISTRSLDIESVRHTVRAVLRGARAGVHRDLQQSSAQAGAARERLREAVNGVDVALAQFAEAAKLAVEEAAGRTQQYSGEDLKLARADLANLEKMFVDTLHSSASAAHDAAGDILHDLAAHARIHGSAVGAQLKDTLAVLARHMAAAGREQIGVGLHLAGNTADLMRQIAAGVLSGIAEHVQPHHSGEKAK